MIDNGHIETAQSIKETLQPNAAFQDVNMDDPKVMLEYYRDNYERVHLVTCDNCGAPLCLWILDKKQVTANLTMHPQGLRRITVGSHLLSTRLRLDNEVGYHCRCGSTSIVNEAEKGIVPQVHYSADGTIINPEASLDLQPHHIAAYHKRVKDNNWKPSVTHHNIGKTSVDGFTTETMK